MEGLRCASAQTPTFKPQDMFRHLITTKSWYRTLTGLSEISRVVRQQPNQTRSPPARTCRARGSWMKPRKPLSFTRPASQTGTTTNSPPPSQPLLTTKTPQAPKPTAERERLTSRTRHRPRPLYLLPPRSPRRNAKLPTAANEKPPPSKPR